MKPDSKPQRVLVIYNTDYDAELKEASNVNVSAVQEAARAARSAVEEYGFPTELLGIHGMDLDRLFRRLVDDPPDLVFNLCESLNGTVKNEPLLPALLDMLSIPYTGPGALTLGLCLHKDRCKEVLTVRGIRTPPYVVIGSDADLEGDLGLDYPYFVKLIHEDASIGIEASNVVNDQNELAKRSRELSAKYNQAVLAERYIKGREVNVTVMGDDDGLFCLPLHEIDFGAMPDDRPHIVSYAAKWDEEHVDYGGTVPVPMRDLSPELAQSIEEISCDAFRALGLRDFGRVDLRIDADDRPWVIDVNPNCDLSPDAGVANAARYGGMEYPQLMGRICELAWRRS